MRLRKSAKTEYTREELEERSPLLKVLIGTAQQFVPDHQISPGARAEVQELCLAVLDACNKQVGAILRLEQSEFFIMEVPRIEAARSALWSRIRFTHRKNYDAPLKERLALFNDIRWYQGGTEE